MSAAAVAVGFMRVVLNCFAAVFLALGSFGLWVFMVGEQNPGDGPHPGGRFQVFCIAVFLLVAGFAIVAITIKMGEVRL